MNDRADRVTFVMVQLRMRGWTIEDTGWVWRTCLLGYKRQTPDASLRNAENWLGLPDYLLEQVRQSVRACLIADLEMRDREVREYFNNEAVRKARHVDYSQGDARQPANLPVVWP